jgi:hypothetical protein
VQGIQICSFSKTVGLLLGNDGGAGAWRWSSWWPDKIQGPRAHKHDEELRRGKLDDGGAAPRRRRRRRLER